VPKTSVHGIIGATLASFWLIAVALLLIGQLSGSQILRAAAVSVCIVSAVIALAFLAARVVSRERK
jgi:hypothetical protein